MRFEYEYELTPPVFDASFDKSVFLLLIGIFGTLLVVSLFLWAIRSFALYTIARRRGLSKPWLSWVPIGGDWILGAVADQYQHLVQRKITSRRMLLLWLRVAQIAVPLVGTVATVLVGLTVDTVEAVGAVELVVSLLGTGITIAALVFYHICNFDLYRSCDPDNAAVYLVVGLLVGVTEPFFYLVNRKKNKGFPVPEERAEPAPLPEVEY